MPPKGPSLSSALRPYRGWLALLVVLTIAANAIGLAIPKFVAQNIDAYSDGSYSVQGVLLPFIGIIVAVFAFTYIQSLVQIYISEIAARDLRTKLIEKISHQSFSYIQKATPEKLLTNLTSDTDAIKQYVAMAIPSIVSSLSLIIGSSILLIITDWKLALVVLSVVPVIGGTFFIIIRRVRALFKVAQEIIDRLNKVINESILASSLIRIVHAEQTEFHKFEKANGDARELGLKILSNFAALIPIITFVASLASLAILLLGGQYVINSEMTLGSLAAFNTYLGLLIFPIIMIGFMSNLIAQSTASYGRIAEVLTAQTDTTSGNIISDLSGNIAVKNIELKAGEKYVLKNISFDITPGSRTAIIGPTGSGKTQLLYLLTGLIQPTAGEILFDGHPLAQFNQEHFLKQIGMVFEDSIIFNMTFRENIAFNQQRTADSDLDKPLQTAELTDFIKTLPEKLDTIASERGSSLSGGQKQRLMLARALAINPKILLLDDFTARVDTNTEQKILSNLKHNYPKLTLVSVTQKVSSVQNYDQIIVLMEGELIAKGTHQELIEKSPEYVQIYNSQRSTNSYELRAE